MKDILITVLQITRQRTAVGCFRVMISFEISTQTLERWEATALGPVRLLTLMKAIKYQLYLNQA